MSRRSLFFLVSWFMLCTVLPLLVCFLLNVEKKLGLTDLKLFLDTSFSFVCVVLCSFYSLRSKLIKALYFIYWKFGFVASV